MSVLKVQVRMIYINKVMASYINTNNKNKLINLWQEKEPKWNFLRFSKKSCQFFCILSHAPGKTRLKKVVFSGQKLILYQF